VTRLVLVGGGRMGEALLGGLLDAGWATAAELAVAEVDAGRCRHLAQRFPGVTVGPEVPEAQGAVVAVKPSDVSAACEAVTAAAIRRVLSIAAGVNLVTLEAALADGTAVVRAMPNTPALVRCGAAAIAGGAAADEDDLAWAETLLGAVGEVVRVPEGLLDAVTGLSGSGPAYIFLVAEALIDAGVLVGLPRPVSIRLTVQTLLGAATMLAQAEDGPERLRADVTSPAGTTAAGLRALESAGVRAALLDAVVAATERSRQLGAG